MTNEHYQEVSQQLLDEAKRIEDSKRPAYTVGNTDSLHNFKSVAQRGGMTPSQAWLVYFLKHIDSISAWAKDPDIPQAESMIGRFADAINYLKLGYAMLAEQQEVNEKYKAKEIPLPDYKPIAEISEPLEPRLFFRNFPECMNGELTQDCKISQIVSELKGRIPNWSQFVEASSLYPIEISREISVSGTPVYHCLVYLPHTEGNIVGIANELDEITAILEALKVLQRKTDFVFFPYACSVTVGSTCMRPVCESTTQEC